MYINTLLNQLCKEDILVVHIFGQLYCGEIGMYLIDETGCILVDSIMAQISQNMGKRKSIQREDIGNN